MSSGMLRLDAGEPAKRSVPGGSPAVISKVPANRRQISVAHVITESYPFGGAQRNTLLTLRGLARDGYATELVCGAGGPLVAETRALGIDVLELPDLVRKTDPPRDFRAFRELCRLFRSKRFDVVHTHSTKAGILGRLAARVARVPAIVHTFHGFPFPLDSGLRSKVFIQVERAVGRVTDASVCVGETLRAEVASWRMPRRQTIRTIYSGIDFDAYRTTRSPAETKRLLGVEDAWPIVGSVGHLREAKAQEILIEAAVILRQEFPRARLLIVGEGERRAELEARIRALGAEGTVSLLGERADVADCLAVFDVFAMSSRWEGVGRALTEALFWGLPTVVTPVYGTKELVLDGKTGLHAPVDDAPALAEAIARLVRDPELARRLGANAKEHVVGQMGLEAMIQGLEALYAELLNGRAGGGGS